MNQGDAIIKEKALNESIKAKVSAGRGRSTLGSEGANHLTQKNCQQQQLCTGVWRGRQCSGVLVLGRN